MREFKARFPEVTAPLTDAQISQAIESNIDLAHHFGIFGETEIMRFLMFAYPVGSSLLNSREFSWARDILEDDLLNEADKMDTIDFFEVFHASDPLAGGAPP